MKLDDIEVEPVDLDALSDETPDSRLPKSVASHLQAASSHASAVSATTDEGARVEEFLLPLERCLGQTCTVRVERVDGSGVVKRQSAPLPGAEEVAPGTVSGLQAARADINGDGRSELWVGYQIGDGHTGPGIQYLAVLSIPELVPLWQGAVSRLEPEISATSCDGGLHPVDVDCDGHGDLVLLQRCGQTRCLNDDSEGCPQPEQSVRVFLWENARGAYRAVPASP